MKIRPNLVYTIFIFNRYYINSKSLQLKALNRIFHYIKFILNLKLYYNYENNDLVNYIDINYIDIINKYKFIENYIFIFYNKSIL